MTDDDRTAFGTALHDRVRDEHPDLDELIRISSRRGTRLRRRRRIGGGVAAVVGVAVVAVVGGQLTGPDTTTGGEPGFATQPSPSGPSSAEARRRERELDRLARNAQMRANMLRAPVRVYAPGWRCDQPADGRITCTKGGASVAVIWRDRATRPDFLDPAKADVLDDVHTFVSEVHGPFFAVVTPAPGTTQAEVNQVGAGLVWT
jgi:hypothetical protein